MKNIAINIFLGILLFIILFPIDASDIPGYSTDEVKAAAQIYSPDCKVEQCG